MTNKMFVAIVAGIVLLLLSIGSFIGLGIVQADGTPLPNRSNLTTIEIEALTNDRDKILQNDDSYAQTNYDKLVIDQVANYKIKEFTSASEHPSVVLFGQKIDLETLNWDATSYANFDSDADTNTIESVFSFDPDRDIRTKFTQDNLKTKLVSILEQQDRQTNQTETTAITLTAIASIALAAAIGTGCYIFWKKKRGNN